MQLKESAEIIILMKLRSFELYEEPEVEIKKYILYCLRHENKEMQKSLHNVCKKHFVQFLPMFNKYSILL